MPKLVKELTQGRGVEQTLSDSKQTRTARRMWRIILDSPGEPYTASSLVGVVLGSPHPTQFGLICKSLSERADGDSRLVRLVEAIYSDPDSPQEEQDKDQPPQQRGASISMSSSLIERPARDVRNVVQDPIDGLSKLVPVVNISISQFDLEFFADFENIGKINSDRFSVRGYLIGGKTCMLRGITVSEATEQFNGVTYSGYNRTYEFVENWDGWKIEYPVEGFNIINGNLNGQDVDNFGLNLEHSNGFVKGWRNNIALADGTINTKMRAAVLVAAPNGKALQRPSSMPVALNRDGTPRARTANPPVLTEEYDPSRGEMVFGTNFSGFSIRLR